jgi:Fur family iron response transcriptional regulator
MATIYNTLKQFTSLGLIREIVVDQNKSLYCNNNQSHYHLYIEDEGKVIDIPTKNIDLDIPSIPACLKLHDIDVIVRIRTLKDKNN